MSEEAQSPARDWSIRLPGLPPFVYDPRVHSRTYVQALADRYSPEAVGDIMRQADELERRAVALGYQLATEAHGLDEALGSHTPPFEPPGEHLHPQHD